MSSFSWKIGLGSLLLVVFLSACGDSSMQADQVTLGPEVVLPDGSRYQGELKDGLLHGEAKLTLNNGDVYQGGFKAGRYHGEGQLSYEGGATYEGGFVNGEFSGKGRYSVDKTWYEGVFEKGTLTGEAEYLDYYGNKYKGEVSGWYANGDGVMTDQEGAISSGTFENGALEGQGQRTHSDGSVYKGSFEYGEYDGTGVLTHADKSVYEGEFSNGKYHGKGTLTEPNSETNNVEVFKGLWKRGVLIFNEITGTQKSDQAELALERHQLLLNTHLLSLDESSPNAPNVYFLGVAGDGKQSVFRREIEYVSDIIEQRYDTQGRSVSLINHHDRAENYPMATSRSINASINAIANKMDIEEDILFVYLSSHGSKNHEFSLAHDSIRLTNLPSQSFASMLQKTKIKWKVIFVSACYSGGFIPDLENETTMVITAADSENTSFGCSEDSEMTYFGKALFREVLSNNIDMDLVEAFKRSKKIIKKWEEDEDLSASNPSISAPKAIVKKLVKLKKNRQ